MGAYDSSLITISGLNEELYARTKDGKYAFSYQNHDDNGNVSQSVFESGELVINIYSVNCDLPTLKTIKTEAKIYNYFSTLSECEGLEDKVDVCSPDYQGDLEFSKVNAEIEKYRKSLEKTDSNNSILQIINDNKILILSVLGIVITLIIVVVVIINYKRNRLE